MVSIPAADRERLVSSLARIAAFDPSSPQAYYRGLIQRVDLPPAWVLQLAGVWSGDAVADARKLVSWALVRGVNPSAPGFTVLGTLLTALLDDQGLEDRATTVALIVTYRLYVDQVLLEALTTRYQVPISAQPGATGRGERPVGDDELSPPGFDLREIPTDVELQSMLGREPDYLDVGFLSRAIERAGAICRVESQDGRALGTGFLLGPGAVLTNCHVVDAAPGATQQERAAKLRFRFRCITAQDGHEAEGLSYGADMGSPLLYSSPVSQLDCALLKLEPNAQANEDLRPVSTAAGGMTSKGSSLHILGHPLGEPLKLAISANGVFRLYEETSRVQYATRASKGSSGSPCFDDGWCLVALHHAEVSRAFGSVREGILIGPILDAVGKLL